ncbi:hypothetical protein MMAN_39640 [Mycobacterium mantenii]|uniref:Uncharacterized protein n=1 Tax=Mycobacterium mantenii TaxID=560555 RepID=A0ABN6A9R5_MYCNT|nr:hypothetical protein [Mycobacterium mantenii]BBY39830.1 hypothetical protein MMAN_39640 [Mycobacterium mantenii]
MAVWVAAGCAAMEECPHLLGRRGTHRRQRQLAVAYAVVEVCRPAGRRAGQRLLVGMVYAAAFQPQALRYRPRASKCPAAAAPSRQGCQAYMAVECQYRRPV